MKVWANVRSMIGNLVLLWSSTSLKCQRSSLAIFFATSLSYSYLLANWKRSRLVGNTRRILLKLFFRRVSLTSGGIRLRCNTASYSSTYHVRKTKLSPSLSLSYENSEPLLILGGIGSKLVDQNGVSYLDTRNNVAHVGHCHPKVVAAVQDQVSELNTNTRYLHPNVCLLAEKLLNLLPSPLEVVFFVNSGSEANDLALRLARAKTRCKNTIVLDHAYHGHTLGTIDVSPYKYKEFNVSENQRNPSHVKKVPFPDLYRDNLQDSTEALQKFTSFVEQACNEFGGRGTVSAIIMESGMSVAGVKLPPKGYIDGVASIVRACGGLFIADEVQTGFGRLGSCMWAFQHNTEEMASFVPDIVTVGKPFGNGMPLAAVVVTRDVSDAFDAMEVEYFNTFGGNPVSAAAGLAMLDVLHEEKLQENAQTVGSYLIGRLRALQQNIPLIGDVRGCGLFIGLELVKNRISKDPASREASSLCTILKTKYQILTSLDGPFANVFVIKPPMVFSNDDVDYFVECFQRAVLEDLPMVELNTVAPTPT